MTHEERVQADRVLHEVIETARLLRHITVRDASYRAGMSEGNWRQLVTSRPPSRAQLLDMGQAVGVRDKVAEAIAASAEEIEASVIRLGHVMDLAERELMHMRHIGHDEKMYLWTCLNKYREEHR